MPSGQPAPRWESNTHSPSSIVRMPAPVSRELAARIALDTGPAVIDAAGEIYGDVANIAARVQALAEPGAVVVTAQVQRQIAGLFVVEPRGTHTLKGFLEPIRLSSAWYERAAVVDVRGSIN